jgi:4-azaleucine resistance transporter AzlC
VVEALESPYTAPVFTRSKECWGGVRATLPLLAGDVPFGLVYGVQAGAAHVPPLVAIAMSSIIFAGSAQIIAVSQLGAAPPVPYPITVLTTLVVNLRHLLYGAAMSPRWRHLPRRWKWLLAYLLTDEAFAVTNGRYQQPDDSPCKHWFYLGAALTLWTSWQAVTLLGVVVGGQVPASWGLDFSVALTFIGIILPVLRDRAVIAAAVAAGLAAVPAYSLPLQLGLIVAAAVGIVTGMVVETLSGGPKPAAAAEAESAPGGD